MSPSLIFSNSSVFDSMLSPWMAAFLETTTLFAFLSAFITLNSELVPSKYCVSLTGLTSTKEPGKNALI